MVGTVANVFVYSEYSIAKIITKKTVRYFYNKKENTKDDLYAACIIKLLKGKSKILDIKILSDTRIYRVLKKKKIKNPSEKELEAIKLVNESNKQIFLHELENEDIYFLTHMIEKKINKDKKESHEEEPIEIPESSDAPTEIDVSNNETENIVNDGEIIIDENFIIEDTISNPFWDNEKKQDLVDLGDI